MSETIKDKDLENFVFLIKPPIDNNKPLSIDDYKNTVLCTTYIYDQQIIPNKKFTKEIDNKTQTDLLYNFKIDLEVDEKIWQRFHDGLSVFYLIKGSNSGHLFRSGPLRYKPNK